VKTLSLSEAKMKLSNLVKTVSATDEAVVITKNIRSDLPLIQEIKKGLKVLKSKKAKLYTLDELFG